MATILLGIYKQRQLLPFSPGQPRRYKWERKVFVNDNEFNQIVYGSDSGPYNIEIYYQDELIQEYVILGSLVIDRSTEIRAGEWLHITGLDRVYKYKELH